MTLDELYEKLVALILQGHGKKEIMVYDQIEAPVRIYGVEIYNIEPEETAVCIVI
jgi:hypothetical protein